MSMEGTTWEQRLQALTHILTSPTTTPSLHSQFFIGKQIPCYLKWEYPPILCSDPWILKRWEWSLFLKRVFRMGLPQTSWRSKCPFQQPPPLILAKGVDEAQWGHEQRRAYVRKRLSRRHLHKNGICHIVRSKTCSWNLITSLVDVNCIEAHVHYVKYGAFPVFGPNLGIKRPYIKVKDLERKQPEGGMPKSYRPRGRA